MNKAGSAKLRDVAASCDALLEIMRRSASSAGADRITPRRILAQAGAWRNAVRTLYAMGGSSNAVLHLLALARSVSRHSPPLTIDDFERLGKDVSHRVGMPSACV